MTSFFTNPNAQYVTAGLLTLSISCGIVGCFSYLRKRSLIGDAIAHATLPGICLAFMASGTKNPVALWLGAVMGGGLGIVCIDYLTTRTRIKPDAALSIVLTVFFGVGILLLTFIQQTGNAAQTGLTSYLFGKAAALTAPDVNVLAIICLIILSIIALFYKEFKLIAFDPDFAATAGLPVKGLSFLLSLVTVAAVAAGIQAVGVVLMAALLIAPAAAARYYTNRLSKMLGLAAFFGAVSGFAGAYISYTAPAMPTGPWVVVVLMGIALLSAVFAPLNGVFFKWQKHKKHQQKTNRENLLKTLFIFGEIQNNNHKQPASISDLAKIRAFPPDFFKRELSRLLKQNLVEKLNDTNIQTWQLTPSGLKEAERVVRLHRLWELYLSQHLNLPSDHIHNDAEAIEHIITPELEKELLDLLEYPEKDPHNSKIPY